MSATPRVEAPGYRPDIDGLRAVAVAAVVVFHAGLSGIPGGFVGVDIFFVISGYLIGGHIFSEVRGGGFRFTDFYARRVRRILPALFVVLIALYGAGVLLLTPLELKELGKEAVPTAFGLSNLLFYTGGGYFAPAAENNPLLMTWSLGVEEQFYLLFPFVMLALARLRARAEMLALLALSLLSFLGSLWMMTRDPTGAFYLLPPRAWELGLGATLAVWERRGGGRTLTGPAGQVAGSLGVMMIVTGLLAYRPAFGFPGWFVTLPVVGTVLVIAARSSLINLTLLSLPPVVFLGRISYSWYLWHWPLFYLHRVLGGTFGPVPLIAVSLVLAVASWRLIETPLRQRVLSERQVLARAAVAAVLVALPGLAFYLTGGLPGRLPAEGRRFAAQAQAARADPCLAPYGATAPVSLARCVPALAGGGQRLLLLGDSHGSSFSPAAAAIARSLGLGFGEMTRSSCLPLAGYARPMPERPGEDRACLAYQRAAFAYVAAHKEVRVVALAGYWPSGLSLVGADGRETTLSEALAATVTRLRAAGRRVILVQDVPTFRFDPYARAVGGTMTLRSRVGDALGAKPMTDDRAATGEQFPDAARVVLAGVSARDSENVALVDPRARLCDAAGCRYRDERDLYYFDFQHMTAAGALASAPAVAPFGGLPR